jgi:hypothetical protein
LILSKKTRYFKDGEQAEKKVWLVVRFFQKNGDNPRVFKVKMNKQPEKTAAENG